MRLLKVLGDRALAVKTARFLPRLLSPDVFRQLGDSLTLLRDVWLALWTEKKKRLGISLVVSTVRQS